MNRDQAKEAIKVMQAWVDGQAIQYMSRNEKTWHDFANDTRCGWDWYESRYRKKPVPKIVERWVVSDDRGNQLTYRTLHEARQAADNWEFEGRTGITLTHLKGEEQPWQK